MFCVIKWASVLITKREGAKDFMRNQQASIAEKRGRNMTFIMVQAAMEFLKLTLIVLQEEIQDNVVSAA